MEYTFENLQNLMDNKGNLYLRGTQITALPDNLTVGGWLDLRGTQITALPDNLTVGGWLDLRGTQITAKRVKQLKDGDYIPGRYLYADGILTHIKEQRKTDKYTYFIGKIPGRNVIFDGLNYAHCDKFADGRDDLLFKAAKDRGSAQYENISLDKQFSVEEAKTMYRVITGACRQGTEQFISRIGDRMKETYSVQEMIDLTKGQYGAKSFAAFFNRKE